MSVKSIVMSIVAGCAVVAVLRTPGIAAQTPPAHQHAAAAAAKPAPEMDAKCQAMMAEKEKVMADMKAGDQRLDGLVATMNTAPETEKMAATAAVVSEMATAGRAMRDEMAKMDQDMMGHMMEHMQAGTASMASCPMMEQMEHMK